MIIAPKNLRIYKVEGFTLVEIAVVLVIVAILLAGIVPTLSSQMEQKNRNETKKKLEEIKEALIGYAVINGRLPCPAAPNTTGVEAFASGGNASNGNCANFWNGFVPASTLGLTGLDSAGYIVDGWNNRIRYAVTTSNANAFTTSITSTTGMTLSGMNPDLVVCPTASTSSTSCSAGSPLTTSAPVVIYSTGPNGSSGGTSADEAENPNPNSADNDRVFASHDAGPNFDDLVVWLSLNTLLNRMVAAGKLP